MIHELDYYVSVAKEAIEDDVERDAVYQKIDDAAHSRFENPPELKALPWIGERKFVSTAPADALNAAIRTFATRSPQLKIQPLSDETKEYERVESLEEAMAWEFMRMNSIGKKSPHWRIVEYAMKYCAVAIETSYLPFLYQDRKTEPRIQEILRSKNFRWDVHDPSNIHVREVDDILQCVVNTKVVTPADLIVMFGREHPGVQEVMERCKDDPKAMYHRYYTLYDVTDWDARVKWIAENDGSKAVNRTPSRGIELMRKERSVSFIPWVFIDNEEPLLKQMVDAGLWDNVNVLRTMQFSKAVDMAAHPEYWIQTPDGTLRGVSIDNQNPNQPLVTGPGVQVNKLIPPQIDPQLANMTAQAESEVYRTTVAQILASVEKYAGTQNFSVVNAMLNAAVAQLSLAQQVAERAETMAMKQNFRWIKETEIPMVAFRETVRGEARKRGQELVIRPKDFDINYLYVTVSLKPTTMMDKQTEINNAINKVERLGMSMKMAWDELDMQNYDLSESQKTEEIMYQALVQTEAKKVMASGEMEIAAKQAQMQQAAQAQANPGPGGPQSQFAAAQGQASRGGANPAARPGQGREQLNGQSMTGEAIA